MPVGGNPPTSSNQLSSQYVEPTAPVRPYVYWRTVLLVFLILLVELSFVKVYRYRFKKRQVHHEHYAVKNNRQPPVGNTGPQRTASAYFGKQPQGPGSVRGSDAGSVASGRPSARQSAYNSAAASTRQSAYNSGAASQQQPTSRLQEA